MGLHFSHGDICFHHSEFNDFREFIWEKMGYKGKLRLIPEGELSDHGMPKNSPMKPFFEHSDCCGSLTVKEMVNMLMVFVDIFHEGAESEFSDQGRKFVDMMQEAIRSNEDLEFL